MRTRPAPGRTVLRAGTTCQELRLSLPQQPLQGPCTGQLGSSLPPPTWKLALLSAPSWAGPPGAEACLPGGGPNKVSFLSGSNPACHRAHPPLRPFTCNTEAQRRHVRGPEPHSRQLAIGAMSRAAAAWPPLVCWGDTLGTPPTPQGSHDHPYRSLSLLGLGWGWGWGREGQSSSQEPGDLGFNELWAGVSRGCVYFQ